MQLLVLILKKIELLDEILKELAQHGIRGGTILDGTGMAEELVHNMEDLPMFGILRQLLAGETEAHSKVLLFVMKDETVVTARSIIRELVGDFKAPNTGILFAIPITYVEGLSE